MAQFMSDEVARHVRQRQRWPIGAPDDRDPLSRHRAWPKSHRDEVGIREYDEDIAGDLMEACRERWNATTVQAGVAHGAEQIVCYALLGSADRTKPQLRIHADELFVPVFDRLREGQKPGVVWTPEDGDGPGSRVGGDQCRNDEEQQ